MSALDVRRCSGCMVPVSCDRAYCDHCQSWGAFGTALARWSAAHRATTRTSYAQRLRRVEQRLRTIEDHGDGYAL